MSDFFEIDFLKLDLKESGDAIPLWYSIDGVKRIHVIDGGFQDTGGEIIEHITKYYKDAITINAVIVSHSAIDHTGGLRTVLQDCNVSELWMLRPWLYAEELIHRFVDVKNVEDLIRKLKEGFADIAELEEIAQEKRSTFMSLFKAHG